MSELPPPTGRPIPYALAMDPWVEQARRHERHVAQQRARRRRTARLLVGPVALVLISGAVLAWYTVGPGDRSASGEGLRAVPDDVAPPSSNGPRVESASDAAAVDEVWLLDRGDGLFDWGAIVASTSASTRSVLPVSVSFLDAGGVEVHREEQTIAVLAPQSSAIVGGSVELAAAARIDVRVAFGVDLGAVPSPTPTLFDIRRVPSGQVDRDDRLLGSVRLDARPGADPVEPSSAATSVRIAALWRDGNGEVVASVIDEVDDVAPDEAAKFSFRLPRSIVPGRAPDTMLASL